MRMARRSDADERAEPEPLLRARPSLPGGGREQKPNALFRTTGEIGLLRKKSVLGFLFEEVGFYGWGLRIASMSWSPAGTSAQFAELLRVRGYTLQQETLRGLWFHGRKGEPVRTGHDHGRFRQSLPYWQDQRPRHHRDLQQYAEPCCARSGAGVAEIPGSVSVDRESVSLTDRAR